MTTQILCAVRAGPESRETVKRAIALALEHNATLTFFHAVDAEFLKHATHSSRRVVCSELLEVAKFLMLILCDRARTRGVADAGYSLATGPAQQQLLRLAAETSAAILVLGRPTRSPSKNVFKPGEFDAFLTRLQTEGRLQVVAVEPAPIADEDRRRGLVL